MNSHAEHLTHADDGFRRFCERRLPEMLEQERLIAQCPPEVQVRVINRVCWRQFVFPVPLFSLGSRRADSPVLLFVGGVHGLERIGSRILLSFLHSLCERLRWDESMRAELKHLRLMFLPVLNPVGMALGWRANGNGVDLMRNAPMDARERAAWLVGGQRFSRRLPWFRGEPDAPMESEAQSLCRLVEQVLYPAPFSLVLDLHSGFGLRDRLWFPYAGATEPPPDLAAITALQQLFDNTHPHHDYLMEPQFGHYLSHGDLWDYLYTRGPAFEGRVFLPLTLEIGSWLWVKKNPRQITSFSGFFNPVVPHRQQRVLRKHQLLLEFLLRATRAYRQWLPSDQTRLPLYMQGVKDWYA